MKAPKYFYFRVKVINKGTGLKVENASDVDVVEVVRCKDCKHRGETPIADGRYWCDIHDAFMYYCSDAERRTDG